MATDQHLGDRQQGKLPERAKAGHHAKGKRAFFRRHGTRHGADRNRNTGTSHAETNQRLTKHHSGLCHPQRHQQQPKGVDKGAKRRHFPRPDTVCQSAKKW